MTFKEHVGWIEAINELLDSDLDYNVWECRPMLAYSTLNYKGVTIHWGALGEDPTELPSPEAAYWFLKGVIYACRAGEMRRI